MKIVSLDKYKEKLKIKRIKADLNDIIQLLNVVLAGLNNYSRYKPVKDILNVIKDKKSILLMYKKKYKKLSND